MKEIDLAYRQLKAHVSEKNWQMAVRAYHIGKEHFFAGRIEKSREYFNKAIEYAPSHHSAYYFLGRAWQRTGHLSTAMTYLQQAKTLSPDNTDVLYLIGINYYQSGSLAVAAEELLKCVQKAPDHLAAWFELGNIHSDRGDWESAIYMFNAAAKLAPSDLKVLLALACAYRKADNLDAAMHWLEHILRIETPDTFKQGYARNLLRDVNQQIEARQAEYWYRGECEAKYDYELSIGIP